jgi:hypothetical protein
VSPSEPRRSAIAYRKLPGDFRGFLRRNTLWLGEDHLLLVDSSRFSETYKRFYLRDIQTIIIRKSPRFMLPYYWVLLAAAALLALLIGLNPFRESFFWPAVIVFGGVAVYLYLACMFQSCACHLITRVNRVEVPSLFRLWSAQRFVAEVAPLIAAAQGALPADWIERSTTVEELSTAADRNPESAISLLPGGQFSWIPVVVFVLVLTDAALTWMQLRANDSAALSTPNMVNLLTLAIFATIALVQLTRRPGGRGLRALVLTGLLVVAAVTYGSVLLQSFDQQCYHQTFRNMLRYAGMRQLGMAEIIADFVVAIPGLILAFRQPKS